jgi:hypothetical protein
MVPYGFAASSGLVNLTFDSSHLSFAVFIVYQFFVSSLVSWRSKKSSNLKTFLLVQILDVINRFVLGKQLSGKIWGNYWGLKEWPEHSPQTFYNILIKKKNKCLNDSLKTTGRNIGQCAKTFLKISEKEQSSTYLEQRTLLLWKQYFFLFVFVMFQ